MAGWRCAAVFGNKDALNALFSLKTNADSSHFRPVLDAATVAMTGDQDWIQQRNDLYRQRRDLIVSSLREMGLRVGLPAASMYVWTPVPQGWDSMDFASQLLEQTAVSVTPGTIFGAHGEGYLRIALTASLERTQEAIERMRDWMESWD